MERLMCGRLRQLSAGGAAAAGGCAGAGAGAGEAHHTLLAALAAAALCLQCRSVCGPGGGGELARSAPGSGLML